MSAAPAAPFLLVVSGLPASGKTTLARRLGDDLALPVLCRDSLRRRIFSGFPTDTRPDQDLVAAATTRLITEVLAAIFAAGGGAVLDGNFNRADHADGLAELLDAYEVDVVEVCLWGAPDILRERFIVRADPPLSDDLRDYFEKSLHRQRVPVVAGARVFEYDTSDFARLDAAYGSLLDDVGRLARSNR